MTRIIETGKYIVEQVQLANGTWVPNKRWNKQTGEREL